MKDFLTFENERNKHNHRTYERLLRLALPQCDMTLIAHHLTFELPGGEPNEIPSADTLMFDHDLMRAAFGSGFHVLLANLATVPCGERDALLAEYIEKAEQRTIEAVRGDLGSERIAVVPA